MALSAQQLAEFERDGATIVSLPWNETQLAAYEGKRTPPRFNLIFPISSPPHIRYPGPEFNNRTSLNSTLGPWTASVLLRWHNGDRLYIRIRGSST